MIASTRCRAVLPLLVVLVLSLPASSAAVVTGSGEELTIFGVVLDEATGEPVADVPVMIAEMSLGTITDRRGIYVLRGVPRARVVVQARANGFIPERREVWGCVASTAARGVCVPLPETRQRLDFRLRSAPVAPAARVGPGVPVARR